MCRSSPLAEGEIQHQPHPHLSGKELNDDEEDTKDEADDLAIESDTIGRALYPGGGVGAQDAFTLGLPGKQLEFSIPASADLLIAILTLAEESHEFM